MRTKKTAAAMLAASAALAVPFAAPATAQNRAGQVNQGNLISALNNIAVQIDRLNALNDLTVQDVQVVNVEDVLNNNNVLNNSLNRNDVDVNVLRDFLNNSLNNNNVEIIKNVLNNNNIDIDDVVAIDVLRNGDVVLFVDVL